MKEKEEDGIKRRGGWGERTDSWRRQGKEEKYTSV